LQKETQLREVLSQENEAEKKLRQVMSNDITQQKDRLRSERNLRLLLLMAVTAMLVLGGIIFISTANNAEKMPSFSGRPKICRC